jgi:hypothetical protein
VGQSTFKLRIGPQGYSGVSGYSGIDGHGGQVGYSGYSGFSGIIGPIGISGYSGLGDSGYSGYSGIGTVGPQGETGESGYSGFSSYSGLEGYSGFSGYSGASGETGPQGEGTSGYSGIEGAYSASGYSGYSGFSSYSGYSGLDGIAGVPEIAGILDNTRISEIEASGATIYNQRGFFVTLDYRAQEERFPIVLSTLDFENHDLLDRKGLEWSKIGHNVTLQSSYIYALPPMINENYPSDMVVTASDFKYNFEPWRALDHRSDMLHSWAVQDSTAWIQVQLETGINIPDKYRIGSVSYAGAYNNVGPRSWELRASTNGVDWDILDSQTDIDWTTTFTQDFTITGGDSTSLYTYFLLDITEANDPAYIVIQQFCLLNWYDIVPISGDNSVYIPKTPDLEIFDLNDIKDKANQLRSTQTNLWKFQEYNWDISFKINLDSYNGSPLSNLFGIDMVGFFGLASIPVIDASIDLIESTAGMKIIGCGYFYNGVPEGLESIGIAPLNPHSLCFFIIEDAVNKVLTVATPELLLGTTYKVTVSRVGDVIKIYLDDIEQSTTGSELPEAYTFPYLNEHFLLGWGMDGRMDDFSIQITSVLTNHFLMYDGETWYDKGLYGCFNI